MSYRSTLVLIVVALCASDSVCHETEKVDGGKKHPPNYFRHPHHAGWIYCHIALMILAWVFVLPVAVMLSIARSRFHRSAELCFHVLSSVGLAVGHLYNCMTPDLYEHEKHGIISWVVTGLALCWSIASLICYCCEGSAARFSLRSAVCAFMPFSWMQKPAKLKYKTTENVFNSWSGSDDDENFDDAGMEKHNLLSDGTRYQQRASKTTRIILRVHHRIRIILDRLLLPLGFAACVSGFVVYSGNFRGLEVYGGLSHWIKGGIFFWVGLFALGRWIGAFADLGWAWNVKPASTKANVPSLEFVESFLIWLYGASNVFLEHLSSTDGIWSATDFEHISITILFFGGGLLGMAIESPAVRRMIDSRPAEGEAEEEGEEASSRPKGTISLNPIPSLTIMLLGLMMSSHHQKTELGTKLHAQWGSLFAGAALARTATLIMLYHKTPSHRPARPVTELLAAFCLAAGGILFMMSGRDSISGLAANQIMAMTAFTATAGLTSVILGWQIVLFAIKGWAERKERHMRKDFAFNPPHL